MQEGTFSFSSKYPYSMIKYPSNPPHLHYSFPYLILPTQCNVTLLNAILVTCHHHLRLHWLLILLPTQDASVKLDLFLNCRTGMENGNHCAAERVESVPKSSEIQLKVALCRFSTLKFLCWNHFLRFIDLQHEEWHPCNWHSIFIM